MPFSHLEYTLAFLTVAAIALLSRRRFKASSRVSSLPLPPGPPCWPIIGSFFSLPDATEPIWIWFTRWANKTKSDTIHFRVLGTDTVVLNTREAALELLEKRSNKYSDRPSMVMLKDLVGWRQLLGMSDYSERTRVIRRYMHNSMSSKKILVRCVNIIQGRRIGFFKSCYCRLRTSWLISDILHSTAGASVVRLTYGYIPKDEDDEYIEKAEHVMDVFSLASTPGTFMVDVFPILRYVPWAPFKRTAMRWRQELSELIDLPMEFVYKQMQDDLAESSFVSQWLEESGHKNDKRFIPAAATSLYAGGADTTVSAISTFFVAMLHYPEAQRLAQKEIEETLGKDILPTFKDRASLPYVEALFKEVMRWKPIAPIGIPHRLGSQTDDEYEGRFSSIAKVDYTDDSMPEGLRIPANSTVIANIWNMLRDPNVYQNPENFDPSRFFRENPEPDPEEVVFGFGRRLMKLAQSLSWNSRCPFIRLVVNSAHTGCVQDNCTYWNGWELCVSFSRVLQWDREVSSNASVSLDAIESIKYDIAATPDRSNAMSNQGQKG
ncbi:cytochrome P450 [Rhizoctonia solani AG-1 IA]|uniref:Cytochrome P450 n=1 Tax=Thanatephorus cucumeris (strain AG1-IA) TaxID=983506 RepID=L8WJE7_THACA|nr:cytochrome P450 [Rhizoctonia solani AG-1 IA]